LAGGHRTVEVTYGVDFPFDSAVLAVGARFVPYVSIHIGTGLMAEYRLTVGFLASRVLLESRV
jgi:hypothetical protein